MPGVSFVITIYNKAPYLAAVLPALGGQSGNFEREFIFVDDGSTDGSADLIEQKTADWPHAVDVIRQPNAGASKATNTGVDAASLPWIKLVDGERNTWHGRSPDHLMRAFMASSPRFVALSAI